MPFILNSEKQDELILTLEQKKAIVNYISGFSTRAILEDVEEVSREWTEERHDLMRKEIDRFVTKCYNSIRKKLEV